MPGLYTHNNRAPGFILTAVAYNADHQNHIDNAVPEMHDDYSLNVSQMRTEADPGEVGTESMPTTLAGELERLRFAIREIKGTTHWYQTPASTLTTFIPSGTLMLFQQTSAPTGWTKQVTHNNKALRVVSGAASSGGSAAFTTIFGTGKSTSAYALTTAEIPSHTHSIPDPGHAHSGFTDVQGDHAHSYNDTFVEGAGADIGFLARLGRVGATTSTNGAHGHNIGINGAFTGISGTNPTGSNAGHSHTLSMDLQFVDLIIASKD